MIFRWLFLILLVLNLLLFVWGYQRPEPVADRLPPLPDGVASLRLMSETEAEGGGQAATKTAEESQPQPSNESADPAAADQPESKPAIASGTRPESEDVTDESPARTCVKLGPFDKEEGALATMDTLSQSGHDVEVQTEKLKTQSGYWVLIPAGAEDPDFIVANLELTGIQDVWRFNKGELAGALSLGLYSDSGRAENRKQELAEKGFSAVIQPRQLEQVNYWVQAKYLEENTPALQALDNWFNANPSMSYPPPACESQAEEEGRIE